MKDEPLPDSWRIDCLELLLCKNVEEIFRRTHEIVRSLGYDHTGVAMTTMPRPGLAPTVIDYNTLPPEWERIRDWERNPMLRETFRTEAPLLILQADEAPAEDRPFFDAVTAIGAGRGYVTNVKRSNAICVIGAMRDAEKISDKERAIAEPRLVYLNNIVAAALTPLLLPELLLPYGARLTRRQREVLRYAADGRSAAEAAAALNISEDTVRQHQRDARARLGARTMTHAVALAIQCGLL